MVGTSFCENDRRNRRRKRSEGTKPYFEDDKAKFDIKGKIVESGQGVEGGTFGM